MVNVLAEPAQFTLLFANEGVTVMVATTGASPALVAVKAAILPEPFAPSPIETVLLLQV